MKVTLNFNIPEEQDKLDMALKAERLQQVINDIRTHMRYLRLDYEKPVIPVVEILDDLQGILLEREV